MIWRPVCGGTGGGFRPRPTLPPLIARIPAKYLGRLDTPGLFTIVSRGGSTVELRNGDPGKYKHIYVIMTNGSALEVSFDISEFRLPRNYSRLVEILKHPNVKKVTYKKPTGKITQVRTPLELAYYLHRPPAPPSPPTPAPSPTPKREASSKGERREASQAGWPKWLFWGAGALIVLWLVARK